MLRIGLLRLAKSFFVLPESVSACQCDVVVVACTQVLRGTFWIGRACSKIKRVTVRSDEARAHAAILTHPSRVNGAGRFAVFQASTVSEPRGTAPLNFDKDWPLKHTVLTVRVRALTGALATRFTSCSDRNLQQLVAVCVGFRCLVVYFQDVYAGVFALPDDIGSTMKTAF